MNKNLIKALFLGILTLSLFLWGCGEKESEPSDVQPTDEGEIVSGQTGNGSNALPEGYVLSARFEDAGGDTKKVHLLHPTHLVNNSLYYYSRTYSQKQNAIVGAAYIQERGEEPRQLNLPTEKETLLNIFTAGEDGSLYLLYHKTDADDKILTYTLEKRDRELQTVYSVDATAGIKEAAAAANMEENANVYINFMEAGADGKLYGMTLSGMVVCWDESGSYQGSFILPRSASTAMGQKKMCFGLANAGPSGIYAYWGNTDERQNPIVHLYDLKKWLEMDDAERKSATSLQVDFSSAPESMNIGYGDMFVFSGYEDGLYLTDQERLWHISLTDGSVEPLLVWMDFTLKSGYVTEIRRQEDGGFLIYVFDSLEQENYWVSLDPVPADQLPQKVELVLGIAGRQWANESLMSKIDQVVLSYNRVHPYSHVTIKEYGNDSITNLQLELLNESGPDILMEGESFFDMETLMAKGAIEDLAPYLDKGEEISKQDILPGILELVMKNGRLPRIPLSFSVKMMILPKDRPQEIMTPVEAAEFMAGGNDTYIDYLVRPRSLLLQILSGAEMDRYVDDENKSCSFDSAEFISLLEQMKKLGDMEMVMKNEDRFESFRSGQVTVFVDELSCMEDYLCIKTSFPDKWEIAGFPNSGRKLRYPAVLYDWLGINSASEHKDEAWGFVEFCLSYMSRSDDVTDRFAVTRDKFDSQTRYESDEPYFVMGNPLLDYNINYPEFDSTTQEETNFLQEISEHLYLYENENLLRIISEETSAFFEGDISAQEAARRIQNRASLVLAE